MPFLKKIFCGTKTVTAPATIEKTAPVERRQEENKELRAAIMDVVAAFRKYHQEKDQMKKIFARQDWEASFIAALDRVNNLHELGILKNWAPESGTRAFNRMIEKIAVLLKSELEKK